MLLQRDLRVRILAYQYYSEGHLIPLGSKSFLGLRGYRRYEYIITVYRTRYISSFIITLLYPVISEYKKWVDKIGYTRIVLWVI